MTGVRDMIPGRGLAVGAGAGPAGLEISAGWRLQESWGLQKEAGRRGCVEVRGLLGGWGAGEPDPRRPGRALVGRRQGVRGTAVGEE